MSPTSFGRRGSLDSITGREPRTPQAATGSASQQNEQLTEAGEMAKERTEEAEQHRQGETVKEVKQEQQDSGQINPRDPVISPDDTPSFRDLVSTAEQTASTAATPGGERIDNDRLTPEQIREMSGGNDEERTLTPEEIEEMKSVPTDEELRERRERWQRRSRTGVNL